MLHLFLYILQLNIWRHLYIIDSQQIPSLTDRCNLRLGRYLQIPLLILLLKTNHRNPFEFRSDLVLQGRHPVWHSWFASLYLILLAVFCSFPWTFFTSWSKPGLYTTSTVRNPLSYYIFLTILFLILHRVWADKPTLRHFLILPHRIYRVNNYF